MSGGKVFGMILVVGLICFGILYVTGGKGIVIDKPAFPRVQIVSPE